MGVKLRAAPRFYLANKGEPAVGWKIYTYEPGTLENKKTYTDNARTATNTNPIILDEYGEADVWWLGSYKVVIKDKNDVIIQTIDNYGAGEEVSLSGTYNLIANGSCELDDDGNNLPDDWIITEYDATSTVILDTDDPNHGTKCLKFVSTGLGGGIAESTLLEVSGSQNLSLAFDVKSSVVDVRNRVEMKWYDKDQILLATSGIWDESAANPTSWTEMEFSVITHASAKYGKMFVYGCHNSDATPGETRFDNMRVIAVIGTMMLQDSDAVDISGGNILGLTNLSTTHLFTKPPVTAGSATAYAADVNESAYVTNRTYAVQIHADNTGACTLNLDSIAATSIKLIDGSDPRFGILRAGMIAYFVFDGTNFVLLNPINLDILNNATALYLGDESDGILTVSADTDLAAGIYQYSAVDIQSTFTLGLSSGSTLIILCTGTVTLPGNVNVDGDGALGGVATISSAPDGDYSINGGGGGGGGGSAASVGGAGGQSKYAAGGDAGATGSAGGVGVAISAIIAKLSSIGLNLLEAFEEVNTKSGGAGGGAGGQKDGINAGGNGGNAGATIIIIADRIDFTGTVSADGLDGDNKGGGDSGAGGGGGGGRALLACRDFIANTGTITAAGGLGGTGGGGGGDGGVGGDGSAETVEVP